MIELAKDRQERLTEFFKALRSHKMLARQNLTDQNVKYFEEEVLRVGCGGVFSRKKEISDDAVYLYIVGITNTRINSIMEMIYEEAEKFGFSASGCGDFCVLKEPKDGCKSKDSLGVCPSHSIA